MQGAEYIAYLTNYSSGLFAY